ncbi:MAG: ATP-dependent DNA helicase PcrA, partial [Tissierellia bacterium]|nr:ATP-dependent DNA helicase PcrA [Tissierellia bacterium]
ERRLMYVALTRAKNNLYLSYAKSRMRHGKINYQLPSSFIEEMDENFTRIKSSNSKKIRFQPKESVNIDYIYNSKKIVDSKSNIPNTNVYTPGQKIKHSKWGTGIITQIIESKGDQLVTVLFDEGGLKTLIGSMAPMEVVS